MTTPQEIGLAAAFLAGLLSFLSPCVLPLVPSYISFVTGMGVEELEAGGDEVRRTALVHALLFVLGFSLVFIALGASATFLGTMLREQQGLLATIGGVIVILFGLHLLGITPLRLLYREKRFQLQRKPAGYAGSVIVGIAFGAGWTPCIGPILGGILTLGFAQETVAEGMRLLGVYSLGLALPFVLTAVLLARALATFKRIRRWLPWIERASGILLILIGLLLVTGKFTVLAAWGARITPEFLLERI